ncbi:MAG: YbbR-like domain-containing protein [Eubacteriales bacterium]
MKQHEFMKDTDENGNESISVSYKPRRRFNLFAFLVCFVIASIIWLWMVNINDTDMTETMVLKIEYVGLGVLEEDEMMIYGMDKNEITVTLRGSNRDIRKHDPEEYKAVVDVTAIKDTGQYTLPLTVKIPEDVNVTVDSAPLNISLTADKIAQKDINFSVMVSNVQDGGPITYSFESTQRVDDIEIDKIHIKGPKQVIDLISYARFNVNGNFVLSQDEMDFSGFPLVFLDKNLNEIVNINDIVEYSTEEIDVHVEATAYKNIPLRIDVAPGVVYKSSTDTISIWGVPSVVRAINEYPIDKTDARPGTTSTIELTTDSFDDGVFVNDVIKVIISFEEITD